MTGFLKRKGVWGLGFGVWGLGFGVWGLGFGVWGLGVGVWGVGVGGGQEKTGSALNMYISASVYFQYDCNDQKVGLYYFSILK